MFKSKNKKITGRNVNSARATRSNLFSYYTANNESPQRVARNRTLNPQQTTNENKPKVPKALGRVTVLLITIFGILIVADLIWLSNKPKVVIVSDTSNSVLLSGSKVYSEKIQEIFSSSPTSRTKISINTNSIENAVQKDFPELSSVSVVLPVIGHTPEVVIQIAKPAVLLKNSNSNFLLDNQGRVIYKITDLSKYNSLSLPVVNTSVNSGITTNQQALSSGDVQFIEFANSQLRAQKISISSMNLPVNTRELDVNVSNPNYMIKFNLEEDPRVQVGTYLAVRQKLASSNTTGYSYIDVRVLGRAYYK
jgi:hypothetical protein